jgi:hypothetical protein
MHERRALRGAPTFATATLGVLVGHWLTYALAYRGVRTRDAVLAQTGHDYLPYAARLALVFALVGAATVLWRNLASRGHPIAGRARSAAGDLAGLTTRLWGIQLATFAAMEVAERLVAGAPLAHLLHDPRFLAVGVAAQLAVAVVGAVLLHALHRAAQGIAGALGPALRLRPTASIRVPSSVPSFSTASLVGAVGVRGPPPVP